MKRATIVGETTGGGAHPVKFHYLEEVKFGMTIPFGRAVNPITNTNWEGTGIKPHVEVPKEEAFDKAYHLALKKLSEKADDEKKEWIEREFNNKGYRLMGAEKIKKAIKVFKKNVEIFPRSANVYDSLGEAYMKNNEKELAIKNFKKSLELDPKNKNAVKMLKKLESSE
jgi:tetratricopeptide (TPR) repeat protein